MKQDSPIDSPRVSSFAGPAIAICALAVTAVIGFTMTPSAQAQTTIDGAGITRIVAGFGGAVAVGDHDVFVAESRNTTEAGAIHVFQKGVSGWAANAKIMADDGEVGDRFGNALAADGSTLLVSSAGVENQGAVYVFTRETNGGWVQTAKLTAPDGAEGDNFGAALAISGNLAVIGADRKDSRTGAAYAMWRNSATDTWSGLTRLTGAVVSDGDTFGSSLAISGTDVFVGASRFDAGEGAVFSFSHDVASGKWSSNGKLPMGDAGDSGFFGSSIAIDGHHVLVGAPRANDGNGLVVTLMHGEDGWNAHESILPVEGLEKSRFGSAVTMAGKTVIVGAPNANGGIGASYAFSMDHMAHGWKKDADLVLEGLEGRAFFGNQIAASEGIVVVGVPGSDHGAGSAAVFAAKDGAWVKDAILESESSNYERVVGEQVNCDKGSASAFGCNQVDLVSFMPVAEIGGGRGVRLNDVWGWTDSKTGREYAIVGRIDGTSFVDISDANNPVYIGTLPRTEGTPSSTWRDMKTYKDHVFVVADGAGEHGMQIFDLTQLRDAKDLPVTFTETAHYDGINSAHNIVINEESGYAYSVGSSSGGETCGGGLHIINIQDPTSPKFEGCFADPTTGRSSTGYSHDAQCVTYHGPDDEHKGKEICFGANETALSIADVSDKQNPVALSAATYPNVGYAHQSWLTEDHKYMLMNDELDELQGLSDGTRTLVWDVTDLDDPKLLKEYVSENKSSDHNLYIKGNFVYQSNYQSGLRILDISDIENPVEFGYFDTVPYGTDTPGFGGSWSNYPFFKSGNVIVTSGSEGLFVVKKRELGL